MVCIAISSMAFVVFLAGCVSITLPKTQETRMNTKLTLSEFNDLLGRYVEKQAFSTLITYPDGESVEQLVFSADGYDSSYVEQVGIIKNKLAISISKDSAAEIILAVDKYLDWEERAKSNGDMFTKLILKTTERKVGHGLSMGTYYNIEFHSGNKDSHYLLFNYCVTGTVIEVICKLHASVNSNNAKILKNEIQEYLDGKIKQRDVASKYN